MDGEYKVEYTDKDGKIKEQEFYEESGIISVIRNLCALGHIVKETFVKKDKNWEVYKDKKDKER